jgi:hypothetical protein
LPGTLWKGYRKSVGLILDSSAGSAKSSAASAVNLSVRDETAEDKTEVSQRKARGTEVKTLPGKG